MKDHLWPHPCQRFSWTVFNSYCIKYSPCTVQVYIVHVYVSTMLHSLTLPWHNCYDTSSIHPWLQRCKAIAECMSKHRAGPVQQTQEASFLNLLFDGLSLRHSKEGVTGLCTSCVGLFHIVLRFHVDLRGVCEISTISWSKFLHTCRGPKKKTDDALQSGGPGEFFFLFFESTFLLGTSLWFQTFFVFTIGERIQFAWYFSNEWQKTTN